MSTERVKGDPREQAMQQAAAMVRMGEFAKRAADAEEAKALEALVSARRVDEEFWGYDCWKSGTFCWACENVSSN